VQQQAESYAEFFIELSAPEEPEEETMALRCETWCEDCKAIDWSMCENKYEKSNQEQPQGEVIEGGEWCINDNYPNELQNGEYDVNISYASSSKKGGVYVPRKIMEEFCNKLNS
jgi:hypothetical protein